MKTLHTDPAAALILNVDDNDGARYAKTRILQHAGFNVAEAASGADALAFVQAQLPDLVLLDVKLPDINGIEVCRRIKTGPSSASVLVLQTSAALTGRADKIRGLEGGADNYLAAPIEADELIANVTALLRLRRTQAELRESEERFRQMAENISDVFWTFSFPDKVLLYVSNAYKTLWQRDAKALSEHPGDWLNGIHADDRERVRERFHALSADQPYDEEYRVVQADGAIRWVRDRCFPVRNGANVMYRIARITSDISEAKNAERMLKEADSHKDEFLATLAHELRNPLGPIRNAVALMQRIDPARTELQAKSREIISRQVDHLARLVDDLLDVARISQGKIALQMQPVEVRTFIDAAMETARPFVDSRRHALELALPENEIWVMGDMVRLAQSINNLLHNAAKYTPQGGSILLQVDSAATGELRVRVQDNGIGISSERLGEIFRLFAQGETAPDRAQDGLGIGLSLVKRLIELHQGKIYAASAGRGKGSTFTIELPVLAVHAAHAPAAASVHAQPGTAAAAGLKVLVVDDNADSLDMMAQLLRELGHEVACAQDASAAMASVNEHVPDVILLDIGLPGIDGYELARMMRKQPELAGARLIALTGYGSERDRQAAMAAGFDHHLVKPASLEQLAALLAA